MFSQNSGFKTSSFSSDFGTQFAAPAVDTLLNNYQQFPKGPAKSGEMIDLYCASKTATTFADFVKQMLILQNHTVAFMTAVDLKDFRAMVSALESVPEISEIKTRLSEGFSAKEITEFYTSKMFIKRK